MCGVVYWLFLWFDDYGCLVIQVFCFYLFCEVLLLDLGSGPLHIVHWVFFLGMRFTFC